MTTLSLNGRSYTDLFAIQPGVAPITTIQSNSVIMAGVTGTVAPSGELNAGNVSVSGQRETANGFLVNGGDVQEHMNGGTSIVPNLDSIEEFRVTTIGDNADQGRSSGGQVTLVTKSGTNTLHGSAYEQYRPTFTAANDWFNKQAALAGIGQTATTQTGAFGANAANNIGNAYQNAADTRASGYLAQGNIWGGAAQGIGNAFANYGSRPKPPPFGQAMTRMCAAGSASARARERCR
jgi:hypothetical protein